jgi:maltose O-acetyltransferase
MNLKVLAGGLLALAYNHGLGRLPLRGLRRLYLRGWLGHWGPGTGVQMGCRFLNGRKIHLGERNIINFGCLLDGRKFPIHTGRDVSIGPHATILTLGHDPQAPDFADRGGAVVIGDRAWIGYGALILPGLTIGEGAVVGAGAVVTKNVEPFAIVAGNPARKIGERNRDLSYQLKFDPLLL